ncbi:SPOR domain-containing protein [Bradyrhizobium sp.]|uniref:SPOR domain-containing protein n=1 Tax=Bradyrhizobium sp. TaxID=376 RepID=UPI002732332C|nr:SPOR domain-containing protein [Bradyrhizobium sp.]MDP3692178.1 SPOR domain-containing protein [Bradyrhizobium sp.]
MADRYQDKPFPADDGYDRGGEPHTPARTENDPLAELARLIGQTDPFAMGRANQPVQPRSEREPYERESYEPEPYDPPAPAAYDDEPVAGPPPWMRRATPLAAPAAAQDDDYEQDYPSAVHPLHRYAAPPAAPEPDYHQSPSYAAPGQEPDPSRYDDALYGEPDPGVLPPQHDLGHGDDPYAYQDRYADADEEPVKKRGGGMMAVAAVLVLAVVGTGAALAYRTFAGSPRSGEPPIIKADNSPTKIVPAPSDGSSKLPDRMATGDGKEKIVPREEAPVDVNARTGPRVVFPPLNPNSNPPSVASVAPTGTLPAAGAGNGTLQSGTEPRRIKTLAVRGDQADLAAAPVNAPAARPAPAPRAAAAPVAAPAASATRSPPSSANASANAPLSLTPQSGQPAATAEPRTRVAATTAAPATSNGGGGYLVQVASQKNESDAQASFRALQGKYPSVLGSRSPLIKRADLGDKGVYYRAMVGPFGSADEATQFCGNLKTAGGQCVIQRN